MKYQVTKTYGHERGFSTAFRQHRADSHCQFIHGYALAFSITFECDELDHRGWVIDFGCLSEIKDWLCNTFDHKLVVATDDPMLTILLTVGSDEWADIHVVDATGCEAFARMVFERVNQWLHSTNQRKRVRVASVSVMEHGSNAATVIPDHELHR